jgi:hypothetical protein
LIDVLNHFQRRERGMAGVAMGGGVLWVTTGSLILCEIKSTKGVSGCVRILGREREQEEVVGVPDVVGIGRGCLQVGSTPAKDFSAAS